MPQMKKNMILISEIEKVLNSEIMKIHLHQHGYLVMTSYLTIPSLKEGIIKVAFSNIPHKVSHKTGLGDALKQYYVEIGYWGRNTCVQ